MAYLDATSLHALPVHFESRAPEPSSILFSRGPQWTRRYQRNKEFDRLNDCFMYIDKGPPMYRLLGPHYNMYKTPLKTEYHFPARSNHYELRQQSAPNYRNGALTFPPGQPPPQSGMIDTPASGLALRDQNTGYANLPRNAMKSLTAWDKYRYLSGPPAQNQIFETVQELPTPRI